MSETLKPCPFCGGNHVSLQNPVDGWIVECHDCGGSAQYFLDNKSDAIAAWNRRADTELVEALREAREWIANCDNVTGEPILRDRSAIVADIDAILRKREGE